MTTLVGQDGSSSGWTTANAIVAGFSGGAVAYNKQYVGIPGQANTAWIYIGAGSSITNNLKIVAYDSTNTLVAISNVIHYSAGAGLVSAPLANTFTTNTQKYTLIVTCDTGYPYLGANTANSNFVDWGWNAAGFSYTSPPSTMPTPNLGGNGYEYIIYLTGIAGTGSYTVANVNVSTQTTVTVSSAANANLILATVSIPPETLNVSTSVFTNISSLISNVLSQINFSAFSVAYSYANGSYNITVNDGIVQNTISHGQTLVLTGSGFGTKSQVAPLLVSRGQGPVGGKDPGWTNSWTSQQGGNANTQNQPNTINITGFAPGTPNPYVGNIIAGCCNNSTAFGDGAFMGIDWVAPGNVGGTFGYYINARFRSDPNRNFNAYVGPNQATGNTLIGNNVISVNSVPSGVVDGMYVLDSANVLPASVTIANINGTLITLTNDPPLNANASGTQTNDTFTFTTDHNFKTDYYGYGQGQWPGLAPYFCYDAGSPANSSQGPLQISDLFAAEGCWLATDLNGKGTGYWYANSRNPMGANSWILSETQACITQQGSANANVGFWKKWEDGTLLTVNYKGPTEAANALNWPNRTLGFGNVYARDRGPNNFTYVSDVVFDIGDQGTLACPFVILGDQPTYAACTKKVYQVANLWSDGSITIPSVWLGELVHGQTAYPYVMNGFINNIQGLAPYIVN